jgi:enediyne polyketide synthase
VGLDLAGRAVTTRIAIVGMACRYPDADGPDQLWQNVLGQRRAFRRIPECRLPATYRGDGPDASYLTHAAVLRDWDFDRERFNVPGPLHRSADHTHWLALETAADALADANHPDLDRDTAGVVLGNTLTGEFSRAATLRLRWPFLAEAAKTALSGTGVPVEEVLRRWESLVKSPFPVPGEESLTGALANTIAGRICNHFDFHGTGYTVDGACASSAVAVLTACRSLAAGELDFALAGGVDMSLDPLELVGFARLGALARGEMRVYDEHPTGFLPGEGCGVVALMRAGDADRAGLRTYAHIVGGASSSDGAGGLSRPECRGQALALWRAYRMAGLPPDAPQLIEGHGTGTEVGDRVELSALIEVRGPRGRKAALSAVKANVGHTKAAAGVAGLIKAALSLWHRVLPPATGCERPHALLRGQPVPLRVLTEPEPWTDPVPRAGVSAMGFGGINTHVVLEGTGARTASAPAPRGVRRPAEIVVLSAPGATELRGRLDRLASRATALSIAELSDAAATAWRETSGGGRYRAALVAATPDELAQAARTAADAEWNGGLTVDGAGAYAVGSGPASRVGLLFPGQAAPVRPELPRWGARTAVPAVARGVSSGTVDTAVAQPAIVRQSLAALAWLSELGTEAVAACGHSLGEITALHWAGACSATTALELAAERGRLMARHGAPGTTMAGLGVQPREAHEFLAGTDVVLAGYNAPGQVTVSGSRAGIAEVVERVRRSGAAATELPVSHGFHGPAMRLVVAPLRRALARFSLDAPSRPVISTVTGRLVAGDIRELLLTQVTSPVLFAKALEELVKRCDVLIEAGPGTVLTGLAATGIPVVSMDCGGDERRYAFATAVLVAARAADLGPWFAGRVTRTLSWEVAPRFVANPCEDRQAPSEPEHHTHGQRRAPDGTPLSALTTHLARTLELPADSITPDRSLLGDLHLNSLQVTQLVSAVAAELGKQAPRTPLPAASAKVADVAAVLAGLPAAQDQSPFTGLRTWVRPFAVRWVPFPPGEPRRVRWSVDAPAGHWLHEWDTGGPEGLAVAMSEATDIADLLVSIARTQPRQLFLVHCGHPAATGLARSVSAEQPSCAVTVVEVPGEEFRVDPDVLLGGRYLELRVRDGVFERATIAALPASTGGARWSEPFEPQAPSAAAVFLVTGGVGGITAHIATELAVRTGCVLVFAGRSPADDPAIRAGLDRVRTRVTAYYESCDIAEPAAVDRLLSAARGRGAIRGLLHGAAVNSPRRVPQITAETLARTLRPKVGGLRVLLDRVGGELRLLLGFGSIIGRQGLAGQAEYCIANDWLRVELEYWAAAHPRCRTHVLEWSVWSGLGMGARMDVLDALRHQGIEPLTPARAAAALAALLDDRDAPVTVLLTSRFPATPTLDPQLRADPGFRFAERTRSIIPGVEAVLEADLAPGSDPYLENHRIDGVRLLPAVLGVEAMAQAASLTSGYELPMTVRARFRAPVTVETSHTVRVAAFDESGGTEVVLRDGATEAFTARIEPCRETVPVAAAWSPSEEDDRPHPWYGTLFFHGERFRRVVRYDTLTAFRVDARLRPAAEISWFSQFHGRRLVLGDPGTHDAALHVLQACVPHRRALPVAVERLSIWRPPEGPLRVLARETGHTTDEYTFDVDLSRPDGTVVARWRQVRLRATGPLSWPDGLPAGLAGPWLSRRLIESEVADGFAQGERTPLVVTPVTAGEPGAVAELIGDKTGENLATATARLRAARLAGQESALPAGDGFRVAQVADDALVVLHTSTAEIITATVHLDSGPAALAVARSRT